MRREYPLTGRGIELSKVRDAWEVGEALRLLGNDLAGLKVENLCHSMWRKLGTTYEKELQEGWLR